MAADTDPKLAAFVRALAMTLRLVDEQHKTAPAWRERVYATLMAHARSACPEAELAAASEVRP